MLPLPRGAVWQMFFLLCAVLLANEVRSEGRVVCYYTNWSVYRPGAAKYNPQNINPYLCTHLVYAFGGFTKDNTMKPFDKYQDIEQGGYAKFTGLKTYNKQLKTMIAIGGWNEASSRFSPLVASSERRQQFIKNILKFLRQNHFDGIDLDWEYPAHREGGKPRDKDNYAQFVQELRTEFDRESAKTGRPRLLLTMAVPAGIQYIEKGYDIPKLNQYLDWFNLLTYDFHSSHEPSANHHAPLYSLEEDDEYNFDTELNIDYSIKYYLNAGADRDKLVLGIPTYGRSYTLINEDSTDIGAPSEGPGEQGDATREKGYLAYYEICQSIKDDPDWTVVQPNPSAMGPYAFKGNLWVGYDDEAIVRKKAEYVVENRLGGIMFWAIDNDDFRGTCTGKPYPLIEAAKEAYLDRLGLGDNEVAKPASRKKPLRSRTRIGSSNRNKVEQVVEKAVAVSQKRTTTKRPQSQRRTTSTTTTTTGSSLYIGGRTTTPEPPTTPDPGSDFKCEDEGFFQHPRDCKKYFWCLDSGPSDLGIVAHMFTCPSGLYFNPAADSCDFARNVPCNKNPKEPPSTTPRPTTTTTTTTTARTTTASSRITAATSRNSFIRFTSTTTQAPDDDDEEYEDEEDESAVSEAEEDPKVIKELIDLIKKVGGIEELEKHLLKQEDGTVTFKKDELSSSGITTTPPSISKSLFDKVLSRPNNLSAFRNKFTSSTLFRSTSKPKQVVESEEEEEEEEEVAVKSNSGSKYSSVVRNSRPGPQNAGIDKLPEFEGFLKEKKKYVTIQRTKPLLVSSDEVSTEEDQVKNTLKDSDVEDDEENENVNVKISSRRPPGSSTPAYTSIRRTKSTTVRPEVVDEDLDDDLIVDKKTYTPLNRNRVRSTPADIETTTVAGSRYKFLERTRPTRRPAATVTAKEDVDEESNGNDDELSVTVQYTDQNEISTQTPTQQAQTTTIRAYASLGRRTTTTPSSSTTTTPVIPTTDQVLTTTSATPESFVIDTTTPEPVIITTTTSTTTNPPSIETSTQSLTTNPIPAISTSTLNPSSASQDDELVTILPKIPNTLATESGLDTQEIDSTQNQILTETTTIDDTNRNEVTNVSTKAATTRIKSQSSLNINSSSSSNSIRGTLNNKFPGGGRRQKTTTASSIDTNQQDQESSTTTSTNEFLGTVSSPRPFGFPRRRTRPTTTTTTTTTIATGGLDDAASSTANPSDSSTQVVKKVSSAEESYLRSSSRLSHNVEGTQNVNGGTSLVVDHVANVDDSLVKGDGVSLVNTDVSQVKRTYSWKDARNPTLRYQKTYPKENLEKIANYYDWQIGSRGLRDDERFAQNGGWSTIWGQAYSPSLTYHDGSRYGGGYGVGLNGYKDFSGKYDSGSYVSDNRGKWRAKSLASDGSTFRRGYGLGGQDIISTFQPQDSGAGVEYVYRGSRIYGDRGESVDETSGDSFQVNDNRGDEKYRADGAYRGWNGRSQGQAGNGAQEGEGGFKLEGQYVGGTESHGFDDGSYRWRGTSSQRAGFNDARDGHQRQGATKTINGGQSNEKVDYVRAQAKHVESGVLNNNSNNLNLDSRKRVVENTEFGLEVTNSNVRGGADSGAGETSASQNQHGFGIDIEGTRVSQGTGATAEQGSEKKLETIHVENGHSSAGHTVTVDGTSVEKASSKGVKQTATGQAVVIQNQEDLSKSTLRVDQSESLGGSLSSTTLQGTDRDLTKHNFLSSEIKTVSGLTEEISNRTRSGENTTISRQQSEDEESYASRRNRNRLGSIIDEEVVAVAGEQAQGSGQSRQHKMSVSSETIAQEDSLKAGGYAGYSQSQDSGSHVVDESVYRNKNLSIPRGFSKFSNEEGLSSVNSSENATSFKAIENNSNSLLTTSFQSGVHLKANVDEANIKIKQSAQGDKTILEADNSDNYAAHQGEGIVAKGATVTEANKNEKTAGDIHSGTEVKMENSLIQSIETQSSGFEESKDTRVSSGENETTLGNSGTVNTSDSSLSNNSVNSEGLIKNSEDLNAKNTTSAEESLSATSAEVSSGKETKTSGITRQRTLVKSLNRTTIGSTSGTASRGRKIVTSFGTGNSLNRTTIRNPIRTRPVTETAQNEVQTVSVNRRKEFRANNGFGEIQNLTTEAVQSVDVTHDENTDITSSSQTSGTTSETSGLSSVLTYRSRVSDQRRTYTNPTVASPRKRILTTRTQLRAQSDGDLNKETVAQTSGSEGLSDEAEYTQATYYEATTTTTRRPRVINRGSFRPVFNDLSSLLALDVHAKHHRTTTTAAPGQEVRRRRPVERTTTEASVDEIQRLPRPTRPPRTTTTTEAPVPTVRPTSLHRAGTGFTRRPASASNSQSQQDNFGRRRKIIRNRIQSDSTTSAGVSSNSSATDLTSEDQTLRGDQLALKANLLSLLNESNSTNATNGSMLAESEVKVNFESGSKGGAEEETIQDSVSKQSVSTAQVTRSRYTFQTRSRPTEVPTTTEIVEVIKPTIPRGKSRLNLPDLSSLLSPDFESKRRVNASVYRLQKTMRDLSANTTATKQVVGVQSSQGVAANVDQKTQVAGSSLKSFTEIDGKVQLEATTKESKSFNTENKTGKKILQGDFKSTTTSITGTQLVGSGIDVIKQKVEDGVTAATIVDGGSRVIGGSRKSVSETKISSQLVDSDATTKKVGDLTAATIVGGDSQVKEGIRTSLSETKITSQLVNSEVDVDVTKHKVGDDLTTATIVDGDSHVIGGGHTIVSATNTASQVNNSDINQTKNLADIDLNIATVIERSNQLIEDGIKITSTSESDHGLSSFDETIRETVDSLSVVTESPTTEDVQSATEELIATLETGFPLPAQSQAENYEIESGNNFRLSSEKSRNLLSSEIVHSDQIQQQDDKYKHPTVPIFSRRNYYKYLQDSPIIYIGKIGPSEASVEHTEAPKKASSDNEINRTIFEVFDVYNDSSKTAAAKDKNVGEATLRPQDNPPKTEAEKNSIAHEINSQLQNFLVPAPRPLGDLGAEEGFTTTEVPVSEINDEMLKLAQDVNSMSVGSHVALLEGSGESSVEESDLEKDSSVNLAPSLTAKQGKSLFLNSITSVNALEVNSMMDHTVQPDITTKKPFGFRSYTSESQDEDTTTDLILMLEDSTTPVSEDYVNSLKSFNSSEETSKKVLTDYKTTAEELLLDGHDSLTTISPSIGYADLVEASTLIPLETDIEADSDTSSPLELLETQTSTESELESRRTAKTLKDRDTFKNQEDPNETGYELVGTSETGSFPDRRLLTPRRRPQANTEAKVLGTGAYRRIKPTITSTEALEESTTVTNDNEEIGGTTEIGETTINTSPDGKTPQRLYNSQVNLRTQFTKKNFPTSEQIGIDFTRAKGFSPRITTNRNRLNAIASNKLELLNGADSKTESITEASEDEEDIIGSTIRPRIVSVGSGFSRRQFGVNRLRTTNAPSDFVAETSEDPNEEGVTEIINASRRPTIKPRRFNRIQTTTATSTLATEASIDLENDNAVSSPRRRFGRLRTTTASPVEISDTTEVIDEDVVTDGEIFDLSTAGTTRRTFSGFNRLKSTTASANLIAEDTEVPEEEIKTETEIEDQTTPSTTRRTFNGLNRIRITTASPVPSTDASESNDEEVTTDLESLQETTAGTTRRTFNGFNRLRTTTASANLIAEDTEVPEEEIKTETEIEDQSTTSTTRRTFNGLNRIRITTASPVPSTDASESNDEEVTADVESLQETTAGTTRRTFNGFNRLRTTTASANLIAEDTEVPEEEIKTETEIEDQTTPSTTRRTFNGLNRIRITTASPVPSTDASESNDEEVTTDLESLQETTAGTTRRTFNGFNRLRTTTASANLIAEDTEVPEEEIKTETEIEDQSTPSTTRRTFNGLNRIRITTASPVPSTDASESNDEEVTADVESLQETTAGTTRRTFNGFNRLRTTTASANLIAEDTEVPEEEIKTETQIEDQSTPSTTRRTFNALNRIRITTASPVPSTDASESNDEEVTTDLESLQETTAGTTRRTFNGFNRLRTTTASANLIAEDTEVPEEEIKTETEIEDQSTPSTTRRTFNGLNRIRITTASPVPSTDASESNDEEVTADVESLQETTAGTTRRTFNGFNRLRTTTASANLIAEDTEVPEEEIKTETEIEDQSTPSTTRRTFNGLNRIRITTASPVPSTDASESNDEEVTADVESLQETTAGTTRRTFNGFNRLRTTTASANLIAEDTEVPEEEIKTETEIEDQTTPSTTRRTFNGLNRIRITTASPVLSTDASESNDEEVTTDLESLQETTAGTTRRTFNGFNRLRTTTASANLIAEDTEVPEEEIKTETEIEDQTTPSTTRRTFNGLNRIRITTASPVPSTDASDSNDEEVTADVESLQETTAGTTRRTFNGFNRLRTTTASSIPLSENTEVSEEETDNLDLTPPSTTRRTFNGFNRLRTTTASSIPLSENTEVSEEETDNLDLTPTSTTHRTFTGFNRLRTTTASSIPLSENTEVSEEEEADNLDLTPTSTTRRTFTGFNRLRTTIASSTPLSENTEISEEADNLDLTPTSTTRRTFTGFNRLRTTTASSIPLSENTDLSEEEETDNFDLTPPSTTRRTFNGYNRLRTTTASSIPLSENTEVSEEEETDNLDLTLPSTTRRTFTGFNRLRTTTASSIPLSENKEVSEEETDNLDLTPTSTTRRTFTGFNRLRTTTASSIPLSENTEVSEEEEADNLDLTPTSTTRRTFTGFNRLRTTIASSTPLSENTEISEEADNLDLTPTSTTRRTFTGFNRLRTTTASSIPLSENTEVSEEEETDNLDLTPPSTTRRTFNGFNRLRTTTASSIPLSENTEVSEEEETDNLDLTLPSTTRRTFIGFNRLRTTTASSIPLSENTEVSEEEETDNLDLTPPSTTRRTFNGFNRLRTTTVSSIPLSENDQISGEEVDSTNSSNSAGNQSASYGDIQTNQIITTTSSSDIVSELEELGLSIVSIDPTLLNGSEEKHANIASSDTNKTETYTTDTLENQENEIESEQLKDRSSIKSTLNFTNAQQARPNFNLFSTSSVKSQANNVDEEFLEEEEDNDSQTNGSEEVTSRNIVALLNRNRLNPIASTRLEATGHQDVESLKSASPESNRSAGIISTRLQRVFANSKTFNRTSTLNNQTNRTITNFTVDTIDERTHTNPLSLTEANNNNIEQTELGPNDDSDPEDSIIENNSNLSTNTPNFDRRFQRVQFNRTAGRRRPNTTTPITTTTTTTRTTTLTQVNPSVDDVNVNDSTSTTNLGLTSETESENDSENGTSEDIETGTSTEAAPKPRRRFRILKFKRPLIVNNSLSDEINNSTNIATVTSTTQTSGSRIGSVDNNNLGLDVRVNNNTQAGIKRFRKVIRRLRPVANRTVSSTETVTALDETTKPLNVAEFISQYNENSTTSASVTEANEISTDDENLTTTLIPDTDTTFDTTISELIDNEVTSEAAPPESTTSRPAPPTPRRLLINRRPYRPTKPSINAITSTDSSSSIATQRTYVRKFNRNFKAIRPPSDSANGIGFIEQASGRPQTDFVGRNRFNFPTRTTTQSTRFEEEDIEEDYDEAINVNQEEDEGVESPVIRPNVQFNLNQVHAQTIEGDNHEEDTEVNDEDNESTEDSEEEDDEEDVQTSKVSSPPPQVVYRPTRPSNRPSFNRPANTPFVPNRPSAAVPANRFPGRAQNKTRVVNRPTLITLPPNLLDSDNPTATASITPPSVFISTNTRSYERKYSATSTEAVPQEQSNPLLEDLNIDALNARNKKIFESNSKKHTTIKPKLIQNQPQPDTTDTPTNSFDTSTVFEEDNEDNNLINSQEASEQTTTEAITEQPTPAAEGELILYSPKQKLVTINRVVEVNSKEDKFRRKSKDELLQTVESTHLRPEGMPKLEALGEISRVKYVHLVDGSKILVDGRSSVTDYTPIDPSTFVRNTIPEVALDSLENTRIDYEPGSTSAPFRNSIPDMDYSSSVTDSASDKRKSKAITVPEVIVDVIESSTISLEGLFDAARQAKKINDASNEVNGIFYAYSLGEVPTTPRNEKPKLVSTTESTTPLTTTTTTTSTTTTTTRTPETTTTTTTSLPTPTVVPSTAPSYPTSTTESADDTTTESTTAPVPAPLVSRPLIPLLRPESNEFPLVRTVGIQGRRPSIRRRLYTTAQPVVSASNDELNTDGISTISPDDDAAVTATTPATTSLFKYNRRTRPSYSTTIVAKLKPTAKVLSSSSLTSSPGEISTIISPTGSAVASSNDVTFVTVNKLPNQKFPSGVIRRKFIRPLNASRSTTTPPSVATVEVGSGVASEEVVATTLPRTQNPLFRRRLPPTTTAAPLTTIRSTEFNTSPLYLDTLIPEDIDQVAKSSIQDSKIFHNQIGDTFADSKHTPDVSISTKLFRSTTPNYTPKDDEAITRRLDIIATTRRALLRRPQKTTPIPEKAPIFISRRRPHKTPAPFNKIIQSPTPGKAYKPELDYDYYDDGDERVIDKPTASQVKVVLHGKGIIECLDQGNFPHPLSCRKFISCAKFENGGVVGWEYTCPKGLSYDPVGGMCNWAAGVGCKE